MFPSSFSARVAERIFIWGALLGFLLLLLAAVEAVYSSRMTEILDDRRAGNGGVAGARREAVAGDGG